ncbi:uncharacterized protein LOC130820976 [Amaranthus tricolor]|uniref:uncharacterized protein LOC130820976 n=1 Tax=Amaranthus tricolor TaxID=29722 RepID=UPI00258D6682|nr:uncharacterized protein LOC130820976 [Amaranthus tricolor]
MGMDYYGILKVSSKANEDELRRAYKKLAMRWHPDKHPSGAKGLAEAKFKQICEAYDVLSDSQKRQIYDLYGKDGLNYNVSSPSAAPPRTTAPSFKYNPSPVPDDLFDDLFPHNSCSPKSDNTFNFNINRTPSPSTDKKAAALENKLVCTLEDLYKGSKRKMKIERVVSDHSGMPMNVEEVLAIDIRPGWKKGTKITFPEKGNQEAGLVPGDLIFVIDEKPHPTFKRDGNDLIVNMKVTLLEALTGKTISMTTLDGRNLNIQVSEIVKPGHELVISGEGMPISKEPKKRGNLRIKFEVKFPTRLSADQKADLTRVLSGYGRGRD